MIHHDLARTAISLTRAGVDYHLHVLVSLYKELAIRASRTENESAEVSFDSDEEDFIDSPTLSEVSNNQIKSSKLHDNRAELDDYVVLDFDEWLN